MTKEARELHQKLLETAADYDDGLMAKVLDGTEPKRGEVLAALRKGTIAMKVVPVLCGSAFKNKGVQQLLDAVVDYLPAPIDIPPVKGKLPNGQEASRPTSEDAPFSALAFKIMTDPFVGQLTFFPGLLGHPRGRVAATSSTRSRARRNGWAAFFRCTPIAARS